MKDWKIMFVALGRNVPKEAALCLEEGWVISKIVPGHDGYLIQMYMDI